MMLDADAYWAIFVVMCGIIVVALCIYFTVGEYKDWEEFKVAHNCKVVVKIASSSSLGFTTTSNGGGLTTVHNSAKTGYLCDDGITYYRNN